MKSCPICKARCFDDIEVCYGCMYNFSLKKEHSFEKSIYEKKSIEPSEKRKNIFTDSFLEPKNRFEGILEEIIDVDSGSSEQSEQSCLPQEVKRENRYRVPRHIASSIPNKSLVESSETARLVTVSEKQGEKRSVNSSPEGGFEERYELVVTVRPYSRKKH